ncbi:hypothetical protein [Legionella rubrilucens]|uniref:hypothetical protein n=1 Tax=Legionella rubrilucens TaxID=458 RepID=UPI00073174E7|nr:hypothetical protein [Legionella rubrilucens]
MTAHPVGASSMDGCPPARARHQEEKPYPQPVLPAQAGIHSKSRMGVLAARQARAWGDFQ